MRIDRPARPSHPYAPRSKWTNKSTRPAHIANPKPPNRPPPDPHLGAAAAAATGLTGWCRRALGSPWADATAPHHGFPRGTVKSYPTKQIRFAHDRCSLVLLRVCLRVVLCTAVGCVERGNFFVDDERLGLDSGDLGGDFALGSLSREIRLHRVSMFRARVDVRTPVLQPVARRSSHAVVLGS